MKNIRGCTIFISVLVGAALCVVAIEQNDSKPRYCRYKGIDIKRGEALPAQIGVCEKVICGISEDGEQHFVSLNCHRAVPPMCHEIEGDLTQSYPACCPYLVCTKELQVE